MKRNTAEEVQTIVFFIIEHHEKKVSDAPATFIEQFCASTENENAKILVIDSEDLHANEELTVEQYEETCVIKTQLNQPTSTRKVYKCNLCDYQTSHSKTNFTRHREAHNSFACSRCHFRTKHKSKYDDHVLAHSDGKEFVCDKCDYRTNTRIYLTYHQRTHVSKEEKPYACDQCDFKTLYKDSLRDHKYKHSGTRLFTCKECDFKAVAKQVLKRHTRRHIVERKLNLKRYNCDLCSFITSQKGNLIIHRRIHIGDKPYACDHCSFRASQKSNLIKHKLVHTEDRPFSCNECVYKGKDKYSLKYHQLIHQKKEKKTKKAESPKQPEFTYVIL